MKKIYQYFYLTIVLIFLASCRSQEVGQQPPPTPDQSRNENYLAPDEKIEIAMGQTLYVPVYSHIYYMSDRKVYQLATTLSIHNTDLTNPIIITSVKYYDTDGKLVRPHLERPLRLAPMASTDFFVEQRDTSGGVGANFLVEWVAEEKVSEPAVETVMIGTAGTQGISFVSPGRVIQNQTASLQDAGQTPSP